jgi:hypothetical protein
MGKEVKKAVAEPPSRKSSAKTFETSSHSLEIGIVSARAFWLGPEFLFSGRASQASALS